MNTINNSFRVATGPNGVGDAVGVKKKQWYVAMVQHNTEKSTSTKLTKMGIQNYIATQSENRVWKDGRKAKVDRVVIPSAVFIKCTEEERRDIVKLPFINRFMTNKAGRLPNSTQKPLAVIPDNQIETLKFMLGQSDIPIEISDKPFINGDKVRVVRGSLAGLEGEVIDMKDAKSEFLISINIFGYARLTIDTINLMKI